MSARRRGQWRKAPRRREWTQGTGIDVWWMRAGFTLPIGPAKPAGPVSVYRTGLVGNRCKLFEIKFEFKILCANGLTGLLIGFTGNPPNSNFFGLN